MSRKPVAFLTVLITVLTGFDATLTGAHVINATQAAWVGGIIAVLTAVLGAVAHAKVTPLADPHDNDGRPLVATGVTR